MEKETGNVIGWTIVMHVVIDQQGKVKITQDLLDAFNIQPGDMLSFHVDTTKDVVTVTGHALRQANGSILPGFLLCEYWRMHAYVRLPQAQGETLYRLDHTCSITTHFKSSGMFDSQLEEDFAQEFEQKMGDKRGHWRLLRESEVLLLGDTVMIPDFVLVDEADETRKILVELVGFWHPNYLRRKVEKAHAAKCSHLLLLVYKGLNVTKEAFEGSTSEVIFFQNKPVLKEVMQTVESMANRIYGPRPKRTKKTKSQMKAIDGEKKRHRPRYSD